jgi:uncharacterized metal-binding protein YceD (DUF177 family)
MSQPHDPAIEFSRPVDTARLKGEEQQVYDIAATSAERAGLARRFGLEALDRLEARVRLSRVAGGYVRLAAELSADVVQTCVATLEPVASRVEDAFALLYGAVEEEGEVVLDNEAETVEPLDGGTIDIGEAVAQQLSLALDPYPRSPEAAGAAGEPAAVPQDSPFAVLAPLAKKD